MNKKLIFGSGFAFIGMLVAFTLFNAIALADEGDVADSAPLTTPQQVCKDAKKSYFKELRNTEAKAISLQLTDEQLKAELDAIKAYKKKACNEARKACSAAKKQYKKDVKYANAKAISLQLSDDDLKEILADLKADQKKACKY